MNTTQTTHWMKRLAVTITARGFCICAHSADFEPSIAPAVHVCWPTTTNKAYQVQVSTNVAGNWTPIGQLIEGTGGRVGTFFDATNGERFFKIQETTASAIPWLHGTWQGPVCQTGPGLTLIGFTVGIFADTTNRVFTGTYTFTNPDRTCVGNLSLLSASETQAQFNSAIVNGSCGNATFLLSRLNQTNVAFQFITPNASATGGGLLTK